MRRICHNPHCFVAENNWCFASFKQNSDLYRLEEGAEGDEFQQHIGGCWFSAAP